MSNIKATFPAGVTALTVHGLHQWDYGRALEISHPDLPAMLEIHFATASDREAIVRVVPGVNGVAVASIPDTLLEQTRPILAWVYVVGETSGETVLTVAMQVEPRPRPAAAPAMPAEMGDKYTEAVAAINAQVASLKEGNVMVANAAHATSADRATAADSASTANKATADQNGDNIVGAYMKKNRMGFQPSMYFQPVSGCLYLFQVTVSGYSYTAAILWAGAEVTASLGYGFVDGTAVHYTLKKSSKAELTVEATRISDGFPIGEQTGWSYSFCQI